MVKPTNKMKTSTKVLLTILIPAGMFGVAIWSGVSLGGALLQAALMVYGVSYIIKSDQQRRRDDARLQRDLVATGDDDFSIEKYINARFGD